jgi:GT2 family glycosyltransferase
MVGIARCNEPPDVFREAIESIRTSSLRPHSILIVDNGDLPLARPEPCVPCSIFRPTTNLGCAASWNLLLEGAYANDCTPILLNADTALSPTTLADMMAVDEPAVVLAYGFGCFRIDEEIFSKVGWFDQDFYPVYCEDVDYRHRMKLLGIVPIEWPIAPTTHVSDGRVRSPAGIVHGKSAAGGYQGWSGEKLAWFHERLEANKARYVAKWGGTPYEEKYTRPFDGTPPS